MPAETHNGRSRLHVLSAATGSQIVELAVSLPLLVVFLVGIFDFGSAFTLKQKLQDAAMVAARIASNQPTRDLSIGANPPCSAPPSICSIRDAVAGSLTANKVNDCGLASAQATAGTLTWTFTPNSSPCPGTLTLQIERGVTYTTTLAAPFDTGDPYTIEATRITLSYPFKWQFSNVIKLVVPGASYAGTTQIPAVAIMQNLN